jgi:DNA mismatch endonuclease (patch repair protein)
VDTFTAQQRSEIMRRVRSAGNRSTELSILGSLRGLGIRGWKVRPAHLPGTPDIFFPRSKTVVFLDGCFWHKCPKCFRLPSSNKTYWKSKIARNKKRDRKTSRVLRLLGFRVLRLWEHEIRQGTAIRRLLPLAVKNQSRRSRFQRPSISGRG